MASRGLPLTYVELVPLCGPPQRRAAARGAASAASLTLPASSIVEILLVLPLAQRRKRYPCRSPLLGSPCGDS
eukprot:5046260-Pyramimonas_sp.AAC.1